MYHLILFQINSTFIKIKGRNETGHNSRILIFIWEKVFKSWEAEVVKLKFKYKTKYRFYTSACLKILTKFKRQVQTGKTSHFYDKS